LPNGENVNTSPFKHGPVYGLESDLSDTEDIVDQTAVEIGLAYRAGTSDPVAVTRCLLDRIEDAWADNAFIAVTRERALAEAQEAASRYRNKRPLSALDGVPIAWKDNIDVAGARSTAGSALRRASEIAETDAPCVANVAAAGMICLGKLNMTEFAYSGLGLNPHFGTPVNPNDQKVHRSPGGSSSGSGAAVAAGLVPCSVGTDTGGSVRIPAAYNGVVGFKTSEGRIETDTMVPLSRTLDTIGPLGRSVTDCALLDMVLRGAVAIEAVRADIADLNIVVATNIVLDEASPDVLENLEASLAVLERAGANVSRRHVKALDEATEITARHGSLTAAEAYHEYHEIIDSGEAKKIDARVVHRIAQGKKMSAHDLLSIQNGRRKAIANLRSELSDALLVMPTTPITAPEVAPLEADQELFHEINLRTLRNTMLGNTLRLCGLAIPNGRDRDNLPTSILFSGVYGDDVRLLSFGLEIERILTGSFEPTWATA
jgi:aspartyl-tRNA(Asn)/glutamyl-tRNA(Gln) amidotransferase subunit A